MNPSLYRLPVPGETPHERARRLLLAAVGILLIYLAVLTQSFAHTLGYVALLGRPFLERPDLSGRMLAALLALLSAGAIGLLAARHYAGAAAAGVTALLPGAFLAGGGLYLPIQILAWLIGFATPRPLLP